jgi:hypothetical protein
MSILEFRAFSSCRLRRMQRLHRVRRAQAAAHSSGREPTARDQE